MANCTPSSVVVLLSGGMDSTLLAANAPPGSVALFVFWDQPAVAEEEAASRKIAERFGLKFRRVEAVVNWGPMHEGIGAVGPRVVGGRNLLFCSLAVSVACECGISRVQIGASLADQAEYPDCRPPFIAALSELAESVYGVRIEAPWLNTERRHIRDRCAALKLETWSCYEPKAPGVPCGTCNACRRCA